MPECPTCRQPLPELDEGATLEGAALTAVGAGARTVPALATVLLGGARVTPADLEAVRRLVRRLVRDGTLLEGELEPMNAREALTARRPGRRARLYTLAEH
jgi:hypothetical protein